MSNCSCNSVLKAIFTCSGAADTGAISDQAARKLTNDGVGKMVCLAGIGGRINGIMASTESAEKILVIDGCPLGCAKKTLEQAGFNVFDYLKVTDFGMEKGKSPVNEERIKRVVDKAKEILNS